MLASFSLKMRLFLLAALAILIAAVIQLLMTPSFVSVRGAAIGSDRFLLDDQGQVIQQVRSNFNRRRLPWLPVDSFSAGFIESLTLVEDKRFFDHNGVDFVGLLRAARSVMLGHRVQGASTITMQLTDLIDPRVFRKNQRIIKGSYTHKLKQIWRALHLEAKWSKQEILEAYLNLIHLKSEFQGVHTFTNAYLKKAPVQLSQAESLVTAALIQAPNRDRKNLERRACQYGKTANTNFDCKKLEPVLERLFNGSPGLTFETDLAPHLAQRLVKNHSDSPFFKTAINLSLQKKVMRILEKNLSHLQKNKVNDAAAIVIENESGNVLAYVGAVDKFSQAGFVDGVDSPRQAGSTLKPFLFADAIDQKIITAASIIEDDETVIKWDGGLYRPSNYDNKFHGPVSARQALASSLNVPAVKMVKMLGLQRSFSVIKNLDFSDLKNPDRYGASLALGAAEVRLAELANVYRAIANGGRLSPLTLSLEPKVNVGEKSAKLMSEGTAYIISSILSDPNARRIGFSWNSALETGMWSAVKTGTSKGLRDNWCVGFTSKYTVAVWAGNFDSTPMQDVSGVTGAGPSWNEIITYLHRYKRSTEPPLPNSVVEQKLKHDWSFEAETEYFLKGTEPKTGTVTRPPLKKLAIVFPANGSTLTLNPHRNQDEASIFIRYKGDFPKGSYLRFNQKPLPLNEGPLKIKKVIRGKHSVEILNESGQSLATSHFVVK